MSVQYESYSYAAEQGEGTAAASPPGRKKSTAKPRPRHQVVALVFSTSGPLNAEQWRTITANVVYTLQEELGVRRTLSIPRRFLDDNNASTRESDEADSAQQPQQPSRVLEIMIPIPQKDPLPTLQQCSAISQRPAIAGLCQRNSVELVLQPHSLYIAHRTPGLAVFDMDSTLIQQEVIDELARAVGRYDQVSAITEAAMRGEAPYTDFEASLRARVGLLAGVPTTIWDHLRTGIISFTPGARELLRVLKKLGWKTAVLSGGFTPLAMWVQQELGLDYCHANHLVDHDGFLTGELVQGKDIIHAEKKQVLLEQIAAQEGVPLENVIAVGDGSNDLLMMHKAGLGIAFNAKPKVQMAAPVKLNAAGLLDVAYVLGYTIDEVTALLEEEMVLEDGQYVLRKLPPS
ncbi:hypothetical protein MBLNU459_g7732t1 [Dothideomycetes sp. NU459]